MATEQQTSPGRDDALETSSIEEVDRTEAPAVHTEPITDGKITISLGQTLVNTTPWQHFIAFSLLAGFDLAMNAAAGAAAATVGAHLNGVPITTKVLRVAAVAGITKSAITSFRELVARMKVNFAFRMMLMLIFSSFGISLVVTVEISNSAYGRVPKELLIAAVVAAVPFLFEAARTLEPKPSTGQDDDEGPHPYLAIFLIASDPLGGYVFARMASNQGMPISNYHAACSAGAVFGTLTWLARVFTALCLRYQRQHGDYFYTVFGTYKKVDFEVTVTHEEYRQMQKAVVEVMDKGYGRFHKIQSLGLGALSKLTYVVPGINREQVRGRLKEKREDVGNKGNQLGFLSWVVHPSWIRTPMAAELIETGKLKGDPVTPDEVASAVVNQIFTGYGAQIVIPSNLAVISLMRGLPVWIQEKFRNGISTNLLAASDAQMKKIRKST
ncbi:hypothetical protein GQ44DRAFT_828519 [Phaeosphaeriaceae sp. PMI808]|nr:hypothetical protein GQ44DRAFT_828519 [Phaeosphaeriaceae sp. PMI808]